MGEANRRRIAEKLGLKIPPESQVPRYRMSRMLLPLYVDEEQRRMFGHKFFVEWAWKHRSDFDLFVFEQGQEAVRVILSRWEEERARQEAREMVKRQTSLLTAPEMEKPA